MEGNRNIDFDSDVEVDSLKDAVWRLTTRVYLLEDFIAERFGEVLTPNGFTKSTVPVVTPQTPNVSSGNEVSSPTRCSRRKRRKHGDRSTIEVETGSNKIQKTLDNNQIMQPTTFLGVDSFSNFASDHVQSFHFEENNVFIPKDEVILPDDNESYNNDDFLVDKSDDEGDTNDSVEDDPDFIPSLYVDDQSQSSQSKGRVQSNTVNSQVNRKAENETESISGHKHLQFVSILQHNTTLLEKSQIPAVKEAKKKACNKMIEELATQLQIVTDEKKLYKKINNMKTQIKRKLTDITKTGNKKIKLCEWEKAFCALLKPETNPMFARVPDQNVSSNSNEKRQIFYWEIIKSFECEDAGKIFLKEEGEWRCNQAVDISAGRKTRYYCKIDRKCQARRYLLHKHDTQTVELYSNGLPHDHIKPKPVRKKGLMNGKMKELINQLLGKGLREPKAVLKALKETSLGNELPSMRQIKTYMMYRRHNLTNEGLGKS